MKSVLVMGGAVFVSNSLAKHLIDRGFQVDILTRGQKTIDYHGWNEHLKCDRRSAEQMSETLRGKAYDVVYDISAYKEEDVRILVDTMGKENIGRYVLCSSGAVYKHSCQPVSEEYDTTGGTLWGAYGLDKRAAEEYLIHSGIPYVIFRPTYVYGENNNLYREAYFFDRINEGKAIPVPIGNDIRTQFIHIEDLVKSFESAAYSCRINRIYNLTHPEQVSWEEYVRKCSAAVGKEPLIKWIDVNMDKRDPRVYFPFRDVTYLLDIQRLSEDGLHIPVISLTEGLKRTWEWYGVNKPAVSDPRMMGIIEDMLMEERNMVR